jgi:hypothetical protein
MGEVVIELVSQGSQWRATCPAGKDLLDHVANQRLGDPLDGKAQHLRRGLTGAGHTGIG